MRKSQPRLGRRLLQAGIATAAVAAAVLATAPPAFAANATVTLSPNAGPITGGTTVTATGTALLTGMITSPNLLVEVRLTSAATCPTTLGTTSATNVAATSPAKVSDTELTFVTPNLTTLSASAATYRVCIYGSNTAGATSLTAAAPIIGNASTAASAFRAYPTATVTPATGQSGGGNTITLENPGLIGTGTTVAALLSTSACPGTYNATGNLAASSTVKTSADVATIGVPTSVASGGQYNVCLYNGTTATSVLLGASSATYRVNFPQALLNTNTGKNGGGNSITATLAGAFTNIASPAAYFTAAATPCQATYTTPGTNLGATTTRISDNAVSVTVPSAVLAPSTYNVCIYNGNTGTSALVATGDSVYTPSVPGVVLSPNSGSSASSTTTITATSTATENYLLGVTAPAATFSTTACPAKYTITGGNFASDGAPIRISNTKAAIKVPVDVVYNTGDGTTSTWNVCVYSGNTVGTDTLVGTSTYRVGAPLDVTAISPGSGPAQGGSTVTVTGTGFTAGMTASIGGAAIENIQVNALGTTFTGTTTPRAAGNNLALTVKTDSGTKSLASAFSYSFGITVTPNTAPSGSTVTLDILGAGFESLAPFTTAGNTANGHIYLVRGTATAAAYDPTETGPASGIKTVGQIQECTNVLIISDLEVLCTLNLNGQVSNATPPVANATPVPNGAYSITVVSSGAAVAAANLGTITRSLITSGSTFTVAPY